MAVSGLLGQQNLQRLEVDCRPARELYARQVSELVVEIHNRRRLLPAFLLRAEMAGHSVLFPLIPAKQQQQLTLTLSLPERGYQPLPPLRVSSCFPINFFVRTRTIDFSRQLLIFPQPLSCQLPVADGNLQQEQRETLTQPGSDGELRNIDNYRAGDSLKAIHWKLSARQDSFKIKRLHRRGAPSLQLQLEQLPGTLEEKLSRCTYLVVHYSRLQVPVGLLIGATQIAPALGISHRHKLLAELALYGRR